MLLWPAPNNLDNARSSWPRGVRKERREGIVGTLRSIVSTLPSDAVSFAQGDKTAKLTGPQPPKDVVTQATVRQPGKDNESCQMGGEWMI